MSDANETKSNFYKWQPDHRIHLSTGALIIDEQGLVLTMFLDRVAGKYFLPTKSHQPDTTLEQTLSKISKKVGWEFAIQDYLGSTQSEFPIPEGANVNKTVIWYKCKPIKEVPRDPEDRDADAEIQWKSREELNQIFANQAHISSDVDQRQVLALLEG